MTNASSEKIFNDGLSALDTGSSPNDGKVTIRVEFRHVLNIGKAPGEFHVSKDPVDHMLVSLHKADISPMFSDMIPVSSVKLSRLVKVVVDHIYLTCLQISTPGCDGSGLLPRALTLDLSRSVWYRSVVGGHKTTQYHPMVGEDVDVPIEPIPTPRSKSEKQDCNVSIFPLFFLFSFSSLYSIAAPLSHKGLRKVPNSIFGCSANNRNYASTK
jgi:hypothetical protein